MIKFARQVFFVQKAEQIAFLHESDVPAVKQLCFGIVLASYHTVSFCILNMSKVKKLFFWTVVMSMVCLTYAKPQAQNDVFNGAKAALKTGNARELAKYFNTNIELIIESENVEMDKVSQTQAELILRTFFQKNPAKDFAYVHQGASPEGSKYSTGTFQSGSKSYLVYIVVKQFGGKYLIDRIDFREKV